MNYLKSSLTLSAVLGFGIGTALLAQVGMGATIGRGADVPWFDRSLVGAAGGITPSVLAPKLCPACEADHHWPGADAPAAMPRAGGASGEARLIASQLESLTVPLIAISDNRVVAVEVGQVDARPPRTSLQ